ncbi:MAG: heterodisulfide reductase-related iron-sulfur binding cluster [Thermodesulfobacteriota bacterium]
MNPEESLKFSYYPGCSVATTAAESNDSLMQVCRLLGLDLQELEDWNCCGSSSAYSLDPELGFKLSARNLSLAPPDRPLLVMCPRCLHHLRHTHLVMQQAPQFRRSQERRWGRPIAPDLEIIHFLEALVRFGLDRLKKGAARSLNGLKFVPYYGCTLFRPPSLLRHKYYQAEVENILTALGGVAVTRTYNQRCCGSFLSAVKPDFVTSLVNDIISSAVVAGADCLVTTCAMCQLNLELRCTAAKKLPIFHFSEILALALGAKDCEGWFARHLVDPQPLLKDRGLMGPPLLGQVP